MARDAELDRLKAAQDLAFNRQQDAYAAQQRAWEQRSSTRDQMNRAHDRKQRAYDAQQSAWQDYQRVRSANGPRIDSLNTLQEHAYQNMRSAFSDASAAHDRRDGASARSYADRGHAYKAESQGYVAERRRLVDEIRTAKARHEPYKLEFQHAKREFDDAKARFDEAKARHERAKVEFEQAKADHERAKEAFRTRLERVKAERKADNRSIAERAGIPYQYRDDMYVSRDAAGNINIYFGGAGDPDGPGHGHYVLDSSGNVTYRRDPFDSHGAHNFTDPRGAGLLYLRSARNSHEPVGTNEHSGVFYQRGTEETGLHVTQYFEDGYRVSWDPTSSGNERVHWTNQNLPVSHPKRHVPPPDATL